MGLTMKDKENKLFLNNLRRKVVRNKSSEALKEIVELASSGNSYAQYSIGEMYWFGDGVEINYDEAVKWLCRATDSGSPEGMVSLSNFLDPSFIFADSNLNSKCFIRSQNIVDFLRKTAFKKFIEESKIGDITVAKWIADCYLYGWGVEHDLEKANEWNNKIPPA
jgi:uncharacterized protein